MCRVVIFSSSEGLHYAKKLKEKLIEIVNARNIDCRCFTWDEDVLWENGRVTLDSLVRLGQSLRGDGYVITLFTPDDVLLSRGKKSYCSRDNVWLEYGLFVGILGIEHVFAVCPDVKVDIQPKENDIIGWHCPSDFQQYRMQYNYVPRGDEDFNGLFGDIANRIELRIERALPLPSVQKNGSRVEKCMFNTSYSEER